MNTCKIVYFYRKNIWKIIKLLIQKWKFFQRSFWWPRNFKVCWLLVDLIEKRTINENKNLKYRFKNGDVYVGHFVNGRLHGKGLYTYLNGNSYEGYILLK